MTELHSVISEYANMVLLETQRGKPNPDSKKVHSVLFFLECKFCPGKNASNELSVVLGTENSEI